MKILTTDELIQELKISRSHLWRLRKAGLPHLKVGGAVRFELPLVEQWLADNYTITGGTQQC